MNRLSNMTRFGFNQERPIFWASSLELIGDWLDVQIELLFNIFRFLGTPGWDAQAVTWILVKNMCWDINFQLKNGCLMLWKTTLDLTLGWEWWKSKDQRHGQIAVWGLTCGLKRWPSKTTPWSILGAKTNDHRGVEICDSHNKTNQNPPIKEAVDQSIWKVKLFVPARGTSLESVICRFFVLTVKRVCCISGGSIGMIFKKWSEMIQKSPNESPVSSVFFPTVCYLDFQGFQSMSPSTFSWQGDWQPHMETLKLWLCCSRCGLLGEGEATFQYKNGWESGKEIPANIVSLGVDVHLDATNYVRVSTIESKLIISSMTQFDPLIPSQPIPWRHQTLLQRFEFRSNCQIHTGSNMMIISVMTLGSHASS